MYGSDVQASNGDDAMRWTLSRLARLAGHDVAPGEIDIRGWLVVAEDGQRAGRVRDVVVDVTTLFVRYLEVELDKRLAAISGTDRAIIPVACARVSANRKHINLRGVTSAELEYAPRVGPRPLVASDETRLRRFYLAEELLTHLTEGEGVAEVLHEQQRFWGMRRRGRALQPYIARNTAAME